MRKSFVPACAVFVIVLLAPGCASAGKAAIRSAGSPIALVSVAANYDINWKGEGETSPAKTSALIRRAIRVDPDWVVVSKSDGIIGEAGEIIRNTLEASPLVTLAPGETVLKARSYNDAKLNPFHVREKMISPEGYRLVYYKDKAFQAGFAEETGIQKTMYVTLALTKSMSSGIGKNGYCRANVAITVLIKDSGGKTLWNKTYEVRSLDRTKVSSGAYSGEELLALFPGTITDACLEFLDDLGR
jgi:hypothetical protein